MTQELQQPPPELCKYVTQARSVAMTDVQIREELLNNGWPEHEVDLLLASATQGVDARPTRWNLNSNWLLLFSLSICALGCGLWFLNSHFFRIPSTPELKYFNSRFRYEITYKAPWRLAESYSEHYAKGLKSLSLIQQLAPECLSDANHNTSTAIDMFKQCVRDHRKLDSIESQYEEYSAQWKPAISEFVVLTDLSEADEVRFLSDVNAGKKTYNDFPAGDKIEVSVMDSILSFSNETATDSKSRLKFKYYVLPDGTKAYESDDREMGYGHLDINVPHEFNDDIHSIGNSAKSLNLSTTARRGDDQEKVFYKVVDSLFFH